MKHEIILAEDNHLGKKGQKVTLELAPSDVHDPTEIPTYLAGYKPFEFRADEATPPILVDNDEDKYRTFSQDDAFEPVNVKQATTSNIPEVDPRSSLDSYKVVDRFIGSFVPWHVENQTGNNYQPRMAAARRCARAILLDRELDVFGPAGLLAVAGSWDASVQTALAAGREWLNTGTGLPGASSNPIQDLQDAIEKSAQPVSNIFMNQRSAHIFIRHPEVKDHMRQLLGDGAAQNTARALEQGAQTSGGRAIDFNIPGLPPIHVSSAKYKPAAGGLSYVMPNVVTLLTIPPGVPTDGEEVASSYTFRRRGPAGSGFESREFHVEGRGPHGGTMVVVSMADIAKMTANTAGGIITGLVQP